MKSLPFIVDSKTGLGHFKRLEEFFGVKNAVTFDSKRWGNMSPKYAINDNEKKEISGKDQVLATDYFDTDTLISVSTPLEPSLLHVTKETVKVLDYANQRSGDGFLEPIITANIVVLEVPDIEVVFAPADCAILYVVVNGFDGVLAMHIGAPQAVQDTHLKGVAFFRDILQGDISMAEVFITPHICPRHYLLSAERREHYISISPKVIEYFASQEDDLYGFDFISLVKEDLNTQFGITTFHESELCTFEEAQNGNLFSHRLSSQQPDRYQEGRFNVAFSLSS
ncbi:laccase domain-containing protein [candidate division WWE3 bacterium]|uniref:Laccase domain-containing protein n=1 Tax=candidate division WWE3 bacterium TaxID=2053526 RepID=A0A955LWF5_UNCKA|nr:laccase domain-containing protein [candidate division WWE3 bacterium]